MICRRLERVYGAVEAPERLPVLDELVAVILSQNTSDSNSGAAFDRLRDRFADWDAVRRAPVARIVQAIRQAGLANRKAPRIKAILRQIHRERGDLSLDFLCCLPTARRTPTCDSSREWAPRRQPACCCSLAANPSCRSTRTCIASAGGWD